MAQTGGEHQVVAQAELGLEVGRRDVGAPPVVSRRQMSIFALNTGILRRAKRDRELNGGFPRRQVPAMRLIAGSASDKKRRQGLFLTPGLDSWGGTATVAPALP